jgi:hypothetical protein
MHFWAHAIVITAFNSHLIHVPVAGTVGHKGLDTIGNSCTCSYGERKKDYKMPWVTSKGFLKAREFTFCHVALRPKQSLHTCTHTHAHNSSIDRPTQTISCWSVSLRRRSFIVQQNGRQLTHTINNRFLSLHQIFWRRSQHWITTCPCNTW